jgi:hypothetical protein
LITLYLKFYILFFKIKQILIKIDYFISLIRYIIFYKIKQIIITIDFRNLIQYIIYLILIILICIKLNNLIIPDFYFNHILDDELDNNKLNKTNDLNKNFILSLISKTKNLIINNMGFISVKKDITGEVINKPNKILSVVHIFFEQQTGENQLLNFYNKCKENNYKFVLSDTNNNNNTIQNNCDINQTILENKNNNIITKSINKKDYENKIEDITDKFIKKLNINNKPIKDQKEELESFARLLLLMSNDYGDYTLVDDLILKILENPYEYKIILNEIDNMCKCNNEEYMLKKLINTLDGQPKHYYFEREEDKATFIFTKSISKTFNEETKSYMSYNSFSREHPCIQYITSPYLDKYNISNHVKYDSIDNYIKYRTNQSEINENIKKKKL